MSALADVQDVIDRWRPLTSAENDLVQTLLDDASNMILIRWPDIAARAASDPVLADAVVRIVASMVRRAVMNRDVEGVTQFQEGVGPFQHSASYANPNGNLFFSADDIRTLDGVGFSKRVRMGWLA